MLIPFGYRKETDKYVDIDEVENGLACNCICPSCEMRLEARHGNEREHHFKHHVKAEKECFFSYWVAVRSMAKQILEQSTFLNVDVERFLTQVPWKNQIIQLDIFEVNPRRKNHGFDFELLTSIGYIYIYFVTPENESSGRYRSHKKNQLRYFTADLILEIDLSMLSSVKKNAKKRLEKLIIDDLDYKIWVTPKYSFHPKSIKPARTERIVPIQRPRNEVESKHVSFEEDIPNYKNKQVIHKELLVAFGLEENRLSREQIRTLNIMIDFYEWRSSHKNKVKTKYFSIIYSGFNVYFISYENEFYGVAELDRYYIYQIIDNIVICIGKSTTFEYVYRQIDNYICERENLF